MLVSIYKENLLLTRVLGTSLFCGRGTQHLITRSLQKRYVYGGNLLLWYSLLMDLRTGLHLLVRSNQPDVDGEHDVHRCVERSYHVADSENHHVPSMYLFDHLTGF